MLFRYILYGIMDSASYIIIIVLLFIFIVITISSWFSHLVYFNWVSTFLGPFLYTYIFIFSKVETIFFYFDSCARVMYWLFIKWYLLWNKFNTNSLIFTTCYSVVVFLIIILLFSFRYSWRDDVTMMRGKISSRYKSKVNKINNQTYCLQFTWMNGVSRKIIRLENNLSFW